MPITVMEWVNIRIWRQRKLQEGWLWRAGRCPCEGCCPMRHWSGIEGLVHVGSQIAIPVMALMIVDKWRGCGEDVCKGALEMFGLFVPEEGGVSSNGRNTKLD